MSTISLWKTFKLLRIASAANILCKESGFFYDVTPGVRYLNDAITNHIFFEYIPVSNFETNQNVPCEP